IPGAAFAQNEKSVVAFYASGRSTLTAAVDSILERTLTETLSEPLDYYPEFFDLARFPDQKYQEALRTFLLSKYGDRRIDLIVADGDTSLDFLTRSRDLLFPGTPIAFVGRGPPPIANATGVIGRVT